MKVFTTYGKKIAFSAFVFGVLIAVPAHAQLPDYYPYFGWWGFDWHYQGTRSGGDSSGSTAAMPPLVATCFANPGVGEVRQNITFTGSVSGGTEPFSYSWSGDVTGSDRIARVFFVNTGTKIAWLTVSDSIKRSAVASCSVHIALELPAVASVSSIQKQNVVAVAAPVVVKTPTPIVVNNKKPVVHAVEVAEKTHNQSLLASVVPASVRAISFSTAYLLFLTLVVFGIVLYLVVIRKKTSHPAPMEKLKIN